MGTADDRLDIMELCCHYAALMDAGRIDRLGAEVFTTGAVIDYGMGEVTGRDAIEGFFGPFSSGIEAVVHTMTNFQIVVDGDTAAGTSRAIAWHWLRELSTLGPSRPADLTGVSEYTDEFERTADGWRISRRVVQGLGTGGFAAGRPPAAWQPLLDGLCRPKTS